MKTSQLHVTGLCVGNSPGTGEFPTQWPVTWKMVPFDDVIVSLRCVPILFYLMSLPLQLHETHISIKYVYQDHVKSQQSGILLEIMNNVLIMANLGPFSVFCSELAQSMLSQSQARLRK